MQDESVRNHEHDTDVISTAFDGLKEQVNALNSRMNWFMTVAGGLIGLMTLVIISCLWHILR